MCIPMDPNFRSLLEAVNEVYLKEGVKGADNTMRKMAAQDRAAGKDKLLSKKEGDKNAAHMGRKIKMSPGYKMEGLDPVGKEDGDVNNDGKKDSSDSYLMKRRKAIAKSMGKDDKMKKEEVDVIEKLISSGKFSKEEIERVAWNEFDENYQAMRNPEKEEEKDKRSARQKRMDSPDKGINSPAFKEFMRKQGM